MSTEILQGDWVGELFFIPDKTFHCCVTSPPYWGLRNYGVDGQIGQENTPEEYTQKLVDGFREIRRVLCDDGTLWLNLGDSYASTGKNRTPEQATANSTLQGSTRCQESILSQKLKIVSGLKPKDLVGIPWMVAFALRADGWYLREEIIWHKPNPMPESVTDRCTRSHEYIFHLSKSKRYYHDHLAIKNSPSPDLIKQVEDGYNGHAIKDYLESSVQDASATKSRIIDNARKRIDKQRGHGRRHAGFNDKWDALTPAEQALLGSNKRSVWTVAPANFRGAHFATFPPKLIEPCILAGCPVGGNVLDPFGGSGTTAQVCHELGRNCTLIELNPEYISLIRNRLGNQISPDLSPPLGSRAARSGSLRP